MLLSNISYGSVINPTRFLRRWSDCHCWNVSRRLLLSEEMTVTLPMQIKLVFTDLPWVCIFIPLWSSNTAWRVPDRSLDKKRLKYALALHRAQPESVTHGKDPLLVPLYNDTVQYTLPLLVPFPFEWSIENEPTKDSTVNSVLKLRLLNVECQEKKRSVLGFNFWRCDRRPVRHIGDIKKNIRVVCGTLKHFVNFHMAEFSQTKPMRQEILFWAKANRAPDAMSVKPGTVELELPVRTHLQTPSASHLLPFHSKQVFLISMKENRLLSSILTRALYILFSYFISIRTVHIEMC